MPTIEETEKAYSVLMAEVLMALDDYCLSVRAIMNACGLPEQVCRGFLKEAVECGFAEYHRGLFDEHGRVAGSGYRITLAGADFVRKSQP